jgi:hypothetical protein
MANGTAVSAPAQSTVNSHGRANTQPLVGPVGPAGFVYGDETAVDAINRPGGRPTGATWLKNRRRRSRKGRCWLIIGR